MRPRPDAAENVRRPASEPRPRQSFNEAAARCRGKHGISDRYGCYSDRRFNEAAARCRGKRGEGARNDGANLEASMRPRPDAAENFDPLDLPAAQRQPASMRPRPDAAEN